MAVNWDDPNWGRNHVHEASNGSWTDTERMEEDQ